MKVYVQGLSALAHYRSTSAKLEIERSPMHVRALADATSSVREIVDMGIWRLGIGEPSAEHPLEVLVPKGGKRSRSSSVAARIWSGPIAQTAFRQVTSNIYVSSPEFMYLQLAPRLELAELAALGMELCGTYLREVSVGSVDAGRTNHITVYHLPPLSTPRRLRSFLNTMEHHAPGRTKALKALDYVPPNSASPLETSLYLLLCLPRRLGGYALPNPELNPPIILSKAGRQHTLRSKAKPDLYWRAAKLDLEFNSNEFHDEGSRTNDSMRRKALERMGVEVIELTTAELYNVRLFHATALRIARHLNKQLRPENEGDFTAKRTALREILLGAPGSKETAGSSGLPVADALETRAEAWPPDADSYIDDDSLSWNQEPADDDSWTDEAGADEYLGPDDYPKFDNTWNVDVPDSGDEGLNVFGRGDREKNRQQPEENRRFGNPVSADAL